MIKAITFDLDNTLIDFMSFKQKASDAAAEAMKKTGFRRGCKKLNEELYQFYLKYGIEEGDIFGAFLKKHKAYNERVLAAAINAYRKIRSTQLKPYPKVKSTLKKLKKKGYKLGIVTDAPKLKAHLRLDLLEITNLFDVIVTVDDTGRTKPSKLPFRKALKALKVKPEEALHVGDWPERDILGAKKSGMHTCLASYGDMKIGKKVWALYCVKKFEELLKVVEEINKPEI